MRFRSYRTSMHPVSLLGTVEGPRAAVSNAFSAFVPPRSSCASVHSRRILQMGEQAFRYLLSSFGFPCPLSICSCVADTLRLL